MRSFTKITFIPLLLISLTVYAIIPAINADGQQDSPPSFMNGSWTGKGYQDNGSQWTIALVADAQKNSYNINYPSLSCGGVWTLKSSDGQKAWFNETITYGKEKCVNGIVVVTQISSDYITYTWFYNDGKLGAFSALKREK